MQTKEEMNSWPTKVNVYADLFLQFCILLLGVDKVENDVECACEHQREEECEACQICISLRAGYDPPFNVELIRKS